jgi:uncharacterized membrane protein affecting hemolysin expression
MADPDRGTMKFRASARTVAAVSVAVILVAAQASVVAFVLGLGPFDQEVPGSG